MASFVVPENDASDRFNLELPFGTYIHTDILINRAGYDVTNYFRSEATAKNLPKNAAWDGFGSNSSAAAFCLPTNWCASCFNVSETVRASDFKIYHRLALGNIYILTGNDVINYSGRQQIVQTCKFWVMFGSRFLDNCSTDYEKIYSFGNWFKGFISSFVAY